MPKKQLTQRNVNFQQKQHILQSTPSMMNILLDRGEQAKKERTR